MVYNEHDVFTIPARRCKRCGGLLTSSQGIRDGYGPCCLRKVRREQADREEEAQNQYSFFSDGLRPAEDPETEQEDNRDANITDKTPMV